MDARAWYEAWAPVDGKWTAWVKPTLFTQGDFDEGASAAVDVRWAPEAKEGTALVIDLVGYYAVDVGLSLAERGYWPVPLFNGMPGHPATVKVDRIQSRLSVGTRLLKEAAANGSLDGPPAFLLDSCRLSRGFHIGRLRVFDNRWAVFPQDVPSAGRFRTAGIKRVLIVTRDRAHLRQDLAEVALTWMQDGMAVWRLALVDDRAQENRSPEIWWKEPVGDAKPSPFPNQWQLSEREHRSFWTRLRWYFTRVSLQRSGAGSFGRMIRVTG